MLSNCFENINGRMTLNHSHSFESASLAASLILGKRTTFREWEDAGCRKLDDYYLHYRKSNIDEMEAITFPRHVADVKEDQKDPLEKVYFGINTTGYTTRYCFVPKRCKAAGYFDIERNRFVVLKGSRFVKDTTQQFDDSEFATPRKRFIEVACNEYDGYYEVHTNVYCKSPSAAASYLAGSIMTPLAWKNGTGDSSNDLQQTLF